MPRLFTGLEIPGDVGFALSLKRGGLHGARWIDPSNYHITLRYIGDVDHRTAHEIVHELDRLSIEEPFDVTLSHLGVFGGKRPRALFAGVDPSPELMQLHDKQERVMQQLGLKPSGRKYSPHVTLARLNDVPPQDMAHHLQLSGAFYPLRFRVGRFVLYSARDSIGGGPYLVEEAYPLAA